jgi:hypothetical protein
MTKRGNALGWTNKVISLASTDAPANWCSILFPLLLDQHRDFLAMHNFREGHTPLLERVQQDGIRRKR